MLLLFPTQTSAFSSSSSSSYPRRCRPDHYLQSQHADQKITFFFEQGNPSAVNQLFRKLIFIQFSFLMDILYVRGGSQYYEHFTYNKNDGPLSLKEEYLIEKLGSLWGPLSWKIAGKKRANSELTRKIDPIDEKKNTRRFNLFQGIRRLLKVSLLYNVLHTYRSKRGEKIPAAGRGMGRCDVLPDNKIKKKKPNQKEG